MCACRAMTTRRAIFRRTGKTGSILFVPPARFPGSTAQGCAGRRELSGWGRQRRHSRAGSGEAGAKTLVVIRTVPSQMYYTPAVVQTRMERWLGESSLQPLLNLVQHHEATYRAIQSFIEKPPGKLRIFEIYPPKPLHSMALGSRIPALREDYKTGRLCGRYFLATVGKLLGKTCRCLVRRRRLWCRDRWWFLPRRWPTMPTRRWWPMRLRPTIQRLIMRIWRELSFYRYALSL